MRIIETVCGVLIGFAITAFGVVLASGIAWLLFDPLAGPFALSMLVRGG